MQTILQIQQIKKILHILWIQKLSWKLVFPGVHWFGGKDGKKIINLFKKQFKKKLNRYHINLNYLVSLYADARGAGGPGKPSRPIIPCNSQQQKQKKNDWEVNSW